MTDVHGQKSVIYENLGGKVRMDVRLLRYRQKQLARLYGWERWAVAKNIIKKGELDRGVACANFARTGADSQNHLIGRDNVALAHLIAERDSTPNANTVRLVPNLIGDWIA